MNKRFFKSPEFLVWLGFGLSAAALLSYALLIQLLSSYSVKSVRKSFITSYATCWYDILESSSIETSSAGMLSGTNNPPSSARPLRIACEAVIFFSLFLVLEYNKSIFYLISLFILSKSILLHLYADNYYPL